MALRRRRSSASPSTASDDAGASAEASWLDLPLLRLAALVGATLLVVVSKGDAFVLAVLLAVGARRYSTGVASVAVAASVVLRWGSPSLGALAGGQAVLGLAGTTGHATDVAAAWCGAAALMMAPTLLGPPFAVSPLRAVVPMVSALPFGLAAAAVVAGPGPGGPLATRVLASAVGVIVGSAVAHQRQRPGVDRVAAVAAVVGGASAVVLAAGT